MSQTLAAGFARTDMRGRYMAVFGLSVSIPAAAGPLAAGIVLDNYRPNLLWYLATVLCAISATGFCALHRKLGAQPRFAPTGAPVKEKAKQMLLAGLLIMLGFPSSAQQMSVSLPAGVKGVAFGQAQRYQGAGKEMCAIVRPLPSPPVFERAVKEISYAVELEPRAVKSASARVVAPAGQELRATGCNIFTPIKGGFSQTQVGSTLSRTDDAPLLPGRYTLRITVDGQTAEIPFAVGR